MTSFRSNLVFAAALFALLGCAGCGDDDGPGATDGGMRPPDAAVDMGRPVARCSPEDDPDRDIISSEDEGLALGVDTDGDGTPDGLDTDSDGDGIPDMEEAGDARCETPPVDTDLDGVPDFRDRDANGDGIDDATQRGDSDGDGVPDWRETDIDGDGIPNWIERGTGPEPVDTDGDGIPDIRDDDSDGDTILDLLEGAADFDMDGIPNFRDLDSDGDGVSDAVEAGDADPATPPVTCTNEVDPITRTPVSPDGTPYPGDGYADWADRDSDNDGFSDGQERAVGTDPCDVDTDDDGIDDLFEGAYVERNCPGGRPAPGARPDVCTCATTASCGIPREDFYLVLPFGGPVQKRVLEFSTSIRVADVFFLTDTTGSMGGTLDNVKRTVATPGTGLIDRIRETIPDAWFGGGQFDDMPFASWGSPPDEPFILAIEMRPPEDAARVQAAFNAMMLHGGGDGPESHTVALWALMNGMGVNYRYSDGGTYMLPNYVGRCLDRGWGAACFREAALPIVVFFTDICGHNGPPGEDASCDPYTGLTPAAPVWAEAIAALNARGAKFIGVNATSGYRCAGGGATVPAGYSPCFYLRRTAEETGSVDLDVVPLVYDLPNTATGTVFADTIVNAVETVATRVPLDVTTRVRAEPHPLADARRFVGARIPGCAATPAITPCVVPPTGFTEDQAVAGRDLSTFFGVIPGTRVIFEIQFQNTSFRGTDRAELFVAYIDVTGGGSAVLDTRQVYIVVPANPVPFG
jgi:hypothetical protein